MAAVEPTFPEQVSPCCWKRCHAHRVAVLIDACNYYPAFAEALRQAQHHVYISAWDLDSREKMIRGEGLLEVTLGQLLDDAVRANPALNIYILCWDFSPFYTFGREPLQRMKLAWRSHRRIHFRFDKKHPTTAARHEKLVVIDDRIAFLGGIDLASRRWDTREHFASHPLRKAPNGKIYEPFHDVQALVDDEAAQVLAEYFRSRWKQVTGKPLKLEQVARDPWPKSIIPNFENIMIGISRTSPRTAEELEIKEVEALYIKAIQQAKTCIYIENQYITARTIKQALLIRLLEGPKCPEILVVLPTHFETLLEKGVMGALQTRLILEIAEADHFNKIRFVFPTVPSVLGCQAVHVHSKLMIVDDSFVTIGSANLNNRSMGLDSELNLFLQSHGRVDVRQAISDLRANLLAEHMGTQPEKVTATLHSTQSLLRCVKLLNCGTRRFEPIVSFPNEGLLNLIPDEDLLDPEEPIEYHAFAEGLVPRSVTLKTSTRPYLRIAALVCFLILLAVAVRFTPLREILHPQNVLSHINEILPAKIIPFAAVAAIAILSQFMIPINLVILGTVLVFQPLPGAIYAYLGALIASCVTYWFGFFTQSPTLSRVTGPRFLKFRRLVRTNGILTLIIVRLMPVGSFTLSNLFAGSLRIPFRSFVWGNVLGLAPGTMAIAFLADNMERFLKNPSILRFVMILILLLLFCLPAAVVARVAKARKKPSSSILLSP
jgi:phospholipase D1/2